MALTDCPVEFCTSQPELLHLCMHQSWPVGQPIVALGPNGPCYCYCTTCLALGTLVEDGDGMFRAVEDFVEGDEVMAAGLSLQWEPRTVTFSGGLPPARQRSVIVVAYESSVLVVTNDHLFTLHGEQYELRRADRLTPSDRLVSPDGDPVEVNGIYTGDYFGSFHHLTAGPEAVGDDNLQGHLINTGNVISADYITQLRARSPAGTPGFVADREHELPVVGSREYIRQFGRAAIEAPQLPVGFVATMPLRVAPFDVPDRELTVNTFIPAGASMLTVPDAARP